MEDRQTQRDELTRQRDEIGRRIRQLEHNERRETGDGQTDNAHEWENAEIREGQIQEALNELRQTEASLERLGEGIYGVCAVCGNPIEPERLELIPETVHCIRHA